MGEGKGEEAKKGEKKGMEWTKKRKSASTQNADTRSMLQRETHNAQSHTLLEKTLPSQDSRHTAAHYDVDMYVLKSGSLAETPKSTKKTHAFGQDITKPTIKTCSRALRRQHV